jgi:hypothetical protein
MVATLALSNSTISRAEMTPPPVSHIEIRLSNRSALQKFFDFSDTRMPRPFRLPALRTAPALEGTKPPYAQNGED